MQTKLAWTGFSLPVQSNYLKLKAIHIGNTILVTVVMETHSLIANCTVNRTDNI